MNNPLLVEGGGLLSPNVIKGKKKQQLNLIPGIFTLFFKRRAVYAKQTM